jgi:hypothetical protein
MMLGLCAVLGNRYQVRSNRESGRRRFDVQLAPLVSGIPGFLFEFKHTNDGHVDLDEYYLKKIVRHGRLMRRSMMRNCAVRELIL